jgi:hypothetical protein
MSLVSPTWPPGGSSVSGRRFCVDAIKGNLPPVTPKMFLH